MEAEFKFQEISVEEWMVLFSKMESSSVTPFFRVSNNIFNSMQWIGKDVIEKPRRKYYGLSFKNEIVCGLNIYYLSESVIRTRGLYCEPSFRRKGLMKFCLESALKKYQGIAERALTFAEKEAVEFYSKCQFQVVSNFEERKIRFYDFSTLSFKVAEESPLTLMQRQL